MFTILFSDMLITTDMAVWEGRLGSEPVQDLIIFVLFSFSAFPQMVAKWFYCSFWASEHVQAFLLSINFNKA